jgi:hypothetical protein
MHSGFWEVNFLSDVDWVPLGWEKVPAYIRDRVRIVQKVIPENELQSYLDKGWFMQAELKSGRIVIEKQASLGQVLEKGVAQLKIGA